MSDTNKKQRGPIQVVYRKVILPVRVQQDGDDFVAQVPSISSKTFLGKTLEEAVDSALNGLANEYI